MISDCCSRLTGTPVTREVVSAVAWLVGVSLLGGLPSSHTTVDTGCTLRARVVIVNLPNREDGPVLRHAWDAIRAGQPEILHIDREDAQAHRRRRCVASRRFRARISTNIRPRWHVRVVLVLTFARSIRTRTGRPARSWRSS
jgi:hypothetical protein